MKKIGVFSIYKNPKDWNLFDKINNIFQIIFGLDDEWENGFLAETNNLAKKIDEDMNGRGLFNSGIRLQAIADLKSKRIIEKRNEKRRMLLEGLNLLPGWIALIFSIIAMIISIVK